jgi:uncharacterized protein (DUF885 family)
MAFWSGYSRRKKIVLGTLTAVTLGSAGFCVPTVWGTPWKIEHFYGRVFLEFALDHPMLLSGLRVLEPAGLTFHNDDLDQFSVAATNESSAMVRRNLEILHEYDRAKLADPLSYDVLDWFLGNSAEGTRWAFHNYPVNQMSGFQSSLPDFMINTHRIDDLEGAEDYVERISKFGVAFDQTLESIGHRENLGIVPPRFVMQRVIREMREFTAGSARDHVLYTHFDAKLAELPKSVRDSDKKALRDRLADEIQHTVFPAYERMIAWFEAREPTANEDVGAWKLPDGDEFYAYQARNHTTTQLTPEEIHALGLREVERIQTEMKTILRGEGYTVGDAPGEFAAVMQRLNREPRFLYPDTDEGRAQILVDYQTIIDEIDAELDPVFSLRPDAAVQVLRVPEFKQKTAPGAYYEAAPLDRSKPGTFFANLRRVEEIPKFGMRTLAYHEAVPGHHFQIAIAQELEGVPFFRKVIPFTAYAEGWALYAERVAAEQGFMDDPYDRLGFLTAELFRASRLVVDSGLHLKQWTRERAIEQMLNDTGMPKTDVVAEIERYIVMPGQALAYKVGQLEILRLRDHARETLGERFDIRAFHAVMLRNGSLPMHLLARTIDEWIAAGGS